MRFHYTFNGNQVVLNYGDDDWVICTNKKGEGLFYYSAAAGYKQVLGTCQFSVYGLTKDAARKKLRRAAIDYGLI